MPDQAESNDKEAQSKVPSAPIFGYMPSFPSVSPNSIHQSPYHSHQDMGQSSGPEIPGLDACESLPEHFQEHYGSDLMSSSISPDEPHKSPPTSTIESYIRHPHPSDMPSQQYTCTFPRGDGICGIKNPRKENITAHIYTRHGFQTFSCDQCGKKFHLKQHFTRHVNGIHGKKPKRGRPRKTRPDDKIRTDKASKTRRSVRLTKERSSTTLSDTTPDASEYLSN